MQLFRRSAAAAGAMVLAGGMAAGVLGGGGAPAGAATASGAPIVIGVECSCTGPLASSTATGAPAFEAWASSVNATGGINGHKVQVIVKDDAFNPGTSVSQVQSLVEQSHAIAIVDQSDVDAGWASYVQQNNIPVIGAVSSSEPFFTNSDFFSEGQTEDHLFDSIVGAAKKVHAKSMALFYCAEAATCQEGVAPLRQTAQKLGVPLVYNASISASAPNYTAQCLAAKQAGAQALFVADAVQQVATAAQDCAQQGWHPAIIVDGESLAPSMKRDPGLATNTIFEMPNASVTSTASSVREMTKAFEKYEPQLPKSQNYSEIAMLGWASGKLFQAAAEAGGLGANGSTPTSQQLYNGLYALKKATLGGIAPPLSFTKGSPNPVDCWSNYVVLKNGKFTQPWGTAPVCAPGSTSG